MLIIQVNQKSAIFVIIGTFLNRGFKFLSNACNRCHELLMMSMNLNPNQDEGWGWGKMPSLPMFPL